MEGQFENTAQGALHKRLLNTVTGSLKTFEHNEVLGFTLFDSGLILSSLQVRGQSLDSPVFMSQQAQLHCFSQAGVNKAGVK